MPNHDIAFEKFLSEEANRYFKAVPSAEQQEPSVAGVAPGSGAIDRAELDLPDDVAVADAVHARPVATLPFANVGNSHNLDIKNPPSSFNQSIGPTAAVPRGGAATGSGIARSGPDDAFTNTLGLLPYQDTYSQQVPLLPASLLDAARLTHTEVLPKISEHAAYYFLAGGQGLPIGAGSAQPADGLGGAAAVFDVLAVRADFPILREVVNGRRLVWLDNAATTQKPQVVIDRLAHFYEHENSNIHRAAHELAARSTDAYEGARNTVKQFLNAASVNEIVFTRGTTESINLVADSWGGQNLSEGDEIILSHLEHHANIVPWQLLSKRKGFKIRVIPVDDAGNLLLDEYVKLLNARTKLVSFTHVSNALGTVTPVKQIIDLAHQAGAKVLLDGAQSVSHIAVDLQYLNPDFFVFSGHKVFGPTGIGVLYAKEALLNSMPPYQGGGNMIKDVSFEHTVYHDAPGRFEAGTGNIADAVGLGAALEYVQRIGLRNIYAYEHQLLAYATAQLRQVPQVKLIGTAHEKTSVLSFTLQGVANGDVGVALNEVGVAVRTGHHCAQPILRRLGYESSVRPSLAFYNTTEEIDLLVQTVERLAWRSRRY